MCVSKLIIYFCFHFSEEKQKHGAGATLEYKMSFEEYLAQHTSNEPPSLHFCVMHNIVACVRLSTPLGVDSLLGAFAPPLDAQWTYQREENFAGFVVRYGAKMAFVFLPSGKILLTGHPILLVMGETLTAFVAHACSSAQLAMPELLDVRIVNMVVAMKMPCLLDMAKLVARNPLPASTRRERRVQQWHLETSSWKLRHVRGTVVRTRSRRPKMREVASTAVVFSNGTCVLVGLRSMEELAEFSSKVYNYMLTFCTSEPVLESDSLMDSMQEIIANMSHLTLSDHDLASISSSIGAMTVRGDSDDDEDDDDRLSPDENVEPQRDDEIDDRDNA